MTRRPPLRVCFVTSELLGAHKNGGIGTATSHLALFLAGAGHSVTLLYTGAPWIDYTSPWIRRCEAAGIAITHFDARWGETYPLWLRETCVIYDHLRTLDQDVILFQDWEGPAFSSIVAKQAGLAFTTTALVVIAHGPTAWLLDANRALARDQRSLAHLHMERVALQKADAVLCPSLYMRDWLLASGEPMAPSVDAVPLYLWSDPDDVLPERQGRALDSVARIAFFGRLETRKGVDLFLDAITSEALADRDFDVVFLGKPASHTPDGIRDVVARRRPSLLARLSFETDLDTDGAQAFLRDRQCLAVIPSLVDNAPCVISECLRRAIPFLSTRTGGIPELVAAEDRERVLVEPRAAALAARIGAVLGQSFAPARPAYAEADVAARWIAWLDGVAARPAPPPAPVRPGERIAVVLTHHERPALLVQTLESLAAQTRTDFDLVLVDDGSLSPDAIAGLRAVESRAWPFRLDVVRQANGYLGAARNAGIRATRAERIVFMDDDNLAFPDMIERLDAAMSRTGVDILTCQMAIFRDAAAEPEPADLFAAERWGFPGGSVELGLSVNVFGDATGMYRRRVFDSIGFFHERRGVGYEDWHLHARAALAGLSILSLPEPLYWYRRVPSGMLMSTDEFDNNRVVWNAYAEALPASLRRLVDLSVRNDRLV
ncbi:glycosyltransferase [Lichenibacterium ramalinae]|nr:glycosyltransferase [Lichenibacterium ramalinae]